MLKKSKIINLINKNKWNDILKNIKNNKIDLEGELLNGKTITHIITINKKEKLIDYLLKKNTKVFAIEDSNGNSSVHTMVINGFDNLLKKTLKKNNQFINLINNKKESVALLMSNRGNLFNWALKNIKNIDHMFLSKNNLNPLLNTIKNSEKENDIYHKNLKLILKDNNIDINLPKSDPPLYLSSRKGKIHLIKELLLVEGININVYNYRYMTPLLGAIYNRHKDITKLLIENNADVNFIGGMGEFNTLVIATQLKDINLIDMLLKNNFNVNAQNKYLETSLHQILRIKNTPHEILFRILIKGNLNIPDIDGTTPLHLLFKNKNWKNFTELIKEKDIDIFKRDNNDHSSLYFTKENDYSYLFDIITEGHIKKVKNFKIKGCNSKNIDNFRCKKLLKDKIIKEKSSLIDKKSVEQIKKDLKLIITNDQNYSRFNSDTIHNILYTIIFLEKFKDLSVPYQHFYNDKYINDVNLLQENNLYKVDEGEIINSLVFTYTTHLYELSPYVIIWRSSTRNYINPYINLALNKCLEDDRKEFIFMRLTIIPILEDGVSGHANIIIFDKKNGILERFEPHGNIPFLEIKKLDKIILEKLGPIFQKYLDKKKQKLEFITPFDYESGIGIQTVSNEYEMHVKKLGDPGGFCLAWVYWYLEMRLKNRDVHPKKMITQVYEEIINKNLERNKKKNISQRGDYSFVDYIRSYANKLDDEKNNLLKKSGIDNHDLYNLIIRQKDKAKLINYITKKFINLIK